MLLRAPSSRPWLSGGGARRGQFSEGRGPTNTGAAGGGAASASLSGAGGPRRRRGGAVSCRRSPTMAAPGGLGRCVAAFWLALAFDAVGLAVLLAGVFADVFFADLLIYAGGIGIFLSLIWWVFWYAGNLEVSPEELRDDVGLAPPKGRGDSVLRGLVHGFSLRLSSVLGTASRSRRAADLELQRARGPPRHSADGSRRVVRGGGWAGGRPGRGVSCWRWARPESRARKLSWRGN